MDNHPLPNGGRHNTIIFDANSYAPCIRAWADHTVSNTPMTQRTEEILIWKYHRNQEATQL